MPDSNRGFRQLPRSLRWLDFIFFLRPALMPPVWTIAICGWARAVHLELGDNWRTMIRYITGTSEAPEMVGPVTESLYWGLMVTCLAGGVYVVNQIADIATDRLNNKLHFLPRGLIHRTDAIGYAILLNIVGFVLAVTGGPGVTIIAILGMISGVVYSLGGQSAWKNRPWRGLAANGISHGTLVYCTGAVLGSTLSPGWRGFFSEYLNPVPLEFIVESIPYLLAVGAVYLGTATIDVEGDRRVGKLTIPARFGPRNAMMLAFCMVVLSILAAIFLDDIPFVLASGISIPFFAIAALRGESRATGLAVKVAVLALSLVAVGYWPPYVIVLVVGFFVTRLYFRWRFGIAYPSF